MGGIDNNGKTLLELIPLAKEQREAATKSLEERKKNEFRRYFEELSKQIKAASFKGEFKIEVCFQEPYFHCTTPLTAFKETIKALEKRGYKVTTSILNSIRYIYIAW